MDNLTHSLTGLMLSRMGLNRWCPRSTPILVLSANISDVDVVTRFAGSLTYLDYHRGWTHSFVVIPLLAVFVVAIVRLAGRKPLPWMRGIVVACIGLLSHVLMDWTNTYGIRFLLPFSDAMPRLDITHVVDLWIWAVLLLAVLGPLLSGLVSGEIGAKKSTGRGAAVFALTLVLLYTGLRSTLHQRAVETVSSHLYEGRTPRRVEAYPHFANPWAWNTVVDIGDAYVLQRISLLGEYDPMGGKLYYQTRSSAALDAAHATDTMKRYLRFAQTVFFRVTPVEKPEGGVQVEAFDLRFGDPVEPRFIATVILDAAQRVVREEYSFGMLRPR
ncbi:MAG: metal-dependent hydrolase [Acidobacteria bacterium]|nr:metal-dependent hydrolase [Acidobacteriota bacterium]